MNSIVIYKTKYGSTKTYAQWIGDELSCRVSDVKDISLEELSNYDEIIYGGGLYAEVINGVHFITKNIDKLKNKKIAIYTTGITPIDCREYYDDLVVKKNFKKCVPENVKIFNFSGKMIIEELSLVHKTALKTLKKIMSSKKEPTEMEKLLVELCDADGDFSNRAEIESLIDYIKNN
ncbi:MAG: flavodoxin [Clostridia bacterium]|nr:flavodoxin [Clostridia bacterium]